MKPAEAGLVLDLKRFILQKNIVNIVLQSLVDVVLKKQQVSLYVSAVFLNQIPGNNQNVLRITGKIKIKIIESENYTFWKAVSS